MRAGWCAVLALALASATRAEEELPLVWARYLLEGPLERVELVGTRGRTALELGLRPGERRELDLPFAHVRAAGEPRLAGQEEESEKESEQESGSSTAELAARVRFLGWTERSAPALPAALRARPRPPWRPIAPRLPAELALVLVALGPVTFALRRRPLLLAGVGLLATVLAVALQARSAPPAPHPQRALEGTRDGQRWLVVDVARELELDPATPCALAIEPTGARVRFRVTLSEGAPRLAVTSPDGALVRRVALDPGLRLLTPSLNTWGSFDEVWIRPARDSDWRAHGPWGLGESLATGPGAGAAGRPPGWLAAGAAQGRGILVARLGPTAWAGGGSAGGDGAGDRAGAPRAGRSGRHTWLRLVGFE